MMSIQKKYNTKVLGTNLTDQQIERHTQELALCAHAELSSIVNATNFKKHHGNLEKVDRDNILFESIDVLRYIQAIQNIWSISPEEIESAFIAKNTYLNARKRIQDNPWKGQPVAIVDMDDVIVNFRVGFANWLNKNHGILPDVESKEYYFISALSKIDVNPEEVFSNFVADDGFARLLPNPGAANFIRSLKEAGYWIQILTARPEEDLRCMYNTYQWLEENNIVYDDIAFSTEKFRWCAKSKYYDHDSISFAIDDSPKHAEDYAKHGIRVKVPVKSYNKHINQEVDYYTSFKELLTQIEEV
jgi:hypothetical protein